MDSSWKPVLQERCCLKPVPGLCVARVVLRNVEEFKWEANRLHCSRSASHNYFNFLSINFGFFFGAATCKVDVLKVNEVVCERKVDKYHPSVCKLQNTFQTGDGWARFFCPHSTFKCTNSIKHNTFLCMFTEHMSCLV